MTVTYNPYDPATIADPYPAYAELRQAAGAHHLAELGFWVVPRYEGVMAVLRDPETYSSRDGWKPIFEMVLGYDYVFGEGEGRNLIASDAPLHTRLRRTVNRAFTSKRIRDLEAHIREITSTALDGLLAKAEDGPVDIVGEFFAEMPVNVIASMLGIAPEERGEFRQWAADLLLGMTGVADPEVVGKAGEALRAYFGNVVNARMANPGDDTISLLISRGADGEDPLTFDEMVGFATMLLVGGADTTVNLLGNWLAVMLARPDLEAELRADRSKISLSIDEVLRQDPVVQLVWRAPTKDVEIDGVAVPKGALLGVLIGSANHDESKWGPDAGEFRLDRDRTGSIGFGWGPHMCIGSHLARLEMKIAIESLIDRVASIESAGPPVRSSNFALRGLSSIPVSLTRAQATVPVG